RGVRGALLSSHVNCHWEARAFRRVRSEALPGPDGWRDLTWECFFRPEASSLTDVAAVGVAQLCLGAWAVRPRRGRCSEKRSEERSGSGSYQAEESGARAGGRLEMVSVWRNR